VSTTHLERRSFVVRYLTLFGGEALSKVCVFVAFAYLARAFGPHKFGLIELALSVTVFCALGAESGLGSYGARMVEQSPAELPRLIPRIIVLRAILSLPAYALILALSERYGLPGIGLLAIYGVLVLLTPLFTQWVFQGLRQMQWVASGSALRYGLFSVLVLTFVRPHTDVRIVALAEVAGATALVIWNAVLLKRIVKIRLDWRGSFSGAFKLLRETWFLGASDLTWAVMWYSPTLIVGWTNWWGRTEQVAWLAASVRVVMALHTFVWLYFFNLIPNLSKELHDSVQGWRMLVHRSLSTSIWIPCLIALTGTLLAPMIVAFVYGAGYEQAVVPLQIVIWMIPVVWLSGHFRFSLIAAGHQHLEFAASAMAGTTTAVLAFVGIHWWGVEGAAAALLTGGIVSAVASGWFMYRVIGPIRVTIAATPMALCLIALLIEVIVSALVNPIAGAVAALLFYGGFAARQWNFTRLRLAWEGRLE
jgi:O-antigen/teichoic acid export membrane protein